MIHILGSDGNETIRMSTINDVLTNVVARNVGSVINTAYASNNERHNNVGNESVKRTQLKLFTNWFVMLIVGLALTMTVLFSKGFDTKLNELILNESSLMGGSLKLADIARVGSNQLKLPIKNVIVMQTEIPDQCNRITCSGSIKRAQVSASYPFYEDVKESFLIGTDGTIFEGRGFSREAEMTYDSFGTSFNRNAIGINIVRHISDEKFQNVQWESLKFILQQWVDEEKLELNYTLLSHYQLIQNVQKNEIFHENIRKFEHFQKGNLIWFIS